MLGEEGAFLVHSHPSPAPAATPFAIEPGSAKHAVFPDPLPNGLRGNPEQIGYAMGGKRPCMGQPDRQPALIGRLVRRVLNPSHELPGCEPGSQKRWFSHEATLIEHSGITLCLLANWYQSLPSLKACCLEFTCTRSASGVQALDRLPMRFSCAYQPSRSYGR